MEKQEQKDSRPAKVCKSLQKVQIPNSTSFAHCAASLTMDSISCKPMNKRVSQLKLVRHWWFFDAYLKHTESGLEFCQGNLLYYNKSSMNN